VQGFVPDPNMMYGSMNHKDTRIDVSAPHAAPAAVYQSERYGNDFAFTFPVPKGERYQVRLHFAEIFDDSPGRRIENVEINGQPVLTNLDIFAAAGGMNKALVREFSGVAPDTGGNIVIRIASASNSPDHNAKISGIEILKPGN
jgi:malectin (di-glucose binding ER protein)